MKVNGTGAGPNPLVLAIAALGCLFFGLNEITQRMLIEVEGVVVSSWTTTGNRPATTYRIRSSDGKEHEYIAGATDQSLPRYLPDGTYLRKNKYELSYIKNGETINDFPKTIYLAACGIGLLLGWWSYSRWRFKRAIDRFRPKYTDLTDG